MSTLQPAPRMRPRPCIGSLMDIPAGQYQTGYYGDQILNGGFSNFIGFAGRGNTFKTALATSISMIVLARYAEAQFIPYDTEMTASWDRFRQLSARYPQIDFDQDCESGRILLTSSAEHSGNEWWHIIREEAKERQKSAKKYQKKTPFVDNKGNPIQAFTPRVHFLDSMSQLQTDAIDEIHDKNEIDASAANTDAMRSAAIKTRLVQQVPQVTMGSGMTLIATAHLGDEVKVDPYAPATHQLQFLQKGVKFKNVPEKFTFLTSNCWVITKAAPLINRNTKASEYPRQGFNDVAGDTDLQELTMINVRNKFGPTGHIFTLIVSQNEGLLPSLSEYHYLKSRKDKFGLLGPEGIHKDYRVALYPEVLVKRTQVRDLLEKDARLARALEITTEMAQIYNYWTSYPVDEMITPEQLRENLEKKGYDWNRLLDTRGYWTFDHYENEVPPLSTMDLLNMYFDRYQPFWY